MMTYYQKLELRLEKNSSYWLNINLKINFILKKGVKLRTLCSYEGFSLKIVDFFVVNSLKLRRIKKMFINHKEVFNLLYFSLEILKMNTNFLL